MIQRHFLIINSLRKNRNFWIVLTVDVCLLIVALFLSYVIRFENRLSEELISQFVSFIPLILLIKIPTFYFFGLYRGMWRYTSMVDLANITKATFIAAILIVAAILYLNRFEGTSRSVFILDSFFSLFFITAHRIAIRSLYNKINHDREETKKTSNTKKALLLIGAGDAAEKVLRELRENHSLPYYPVGLLDDDASITGLNIHGVPVLGCIDDLLKHVELTRAEEILISISSATGGEMKRIIGICQSSQIPFKVLPGLGELIDGKVSIKAIRDISYKDLLGREEVVLEHEKIGDYITGKTILITGAGGSIGSELCRQILRFSPRSSYPFGQQ